MTPNGIFNGYTVFASEACADTVQARRHRKKRINKKWLKRYGTKTVPWNKVIVTADRKMIMHPKIYEALAAELMIEKIKEE